MPNRQAHSVSPHGPREVQELTRAFNEMSQRVLASHKSQRDFVANVSHEFKTPLTSIQGFAQALQDGTANTAQSRRHAADVIQQQAERLHSMAVDLLDLARLDAGTFDLQITSMDIKPLLAGIVEKFSPMAESAGVSIQVICGDAPSIKGDGDRLAQVFSNLIDNALKFTPAGGQILISTKRNASMLDIIVTDTGKGISPEDLPHLFERFYRADRARTGGARQGTGLGLAIAQEIVSAHGGKITVRSEPGAGSIFIVSLPIQS
jgi:two-component system sensor histidine kinase ResE